MTKKMGSKALTDYLILKAFFMLGFRNGEQTKKHWFLTNNNLPVG
jgi:hypothetical protein